jgi:chemotaxis protein methyltransferase CheR
VNSEEYELIKKKIRQLINLDLDNYRANQMMRRLDGFIARNNAKNVTQYCGIIEHDASELAKLQDFLTINVSEFFRDIPYFTNLEQVILPALMKFSSKLNIWSAGCSNGSEAYSVAMILDKIAPFGSHKISGSDIDDGSLKRAMAGGPYSISDVKNVPPHYLSRYFQQTNGNYQVVEGIRKTVRFKKQDLLCDTFENNFDLIICRNVVIYFSDEAKKKLKKKFYDSLKSHGVLFIGATETMLDAQNLGFQKIHPGFYQKTVETVSDRVRVLQSV